MGGEGLPFWHVTTQGAKVKKEAPARGLGGWILSRRARAGGGPPSEDSRLLIPRKGGAGAFVRSDR